MITDTIRRIEERVRSSTTLSAENRAALLILLEQLKIELAALPESQRDQAKSVAGFAELSAHEATKAATDSGLMQVALMGLRQSVGEFEQSHPRLVTVINAISTQLANLGI